MRLQHGEDDPGTDWRRTSRRDASDQAERGVDMTEKRAPPHIHTHRALSKPGGVDQSSRRGRDWKRINECMTIDLC